MRVKSWITSPSQLHTVVVPTAVLGTVKHERISATTINATLQLFLRINTDTPGARFRLPRLTLVDVHSSIQPANRQSPQCLPLRQSAVNQFGGHLEWVGTFSTELFVWSSCPMREPVAPARTRSARHSGVRRPPARACRRSRGSVAEPEFRGKSMLGLGADLGWLA